MIGVVGSKETNEGVNIKVTEEEIVASVSAMVQSIRLVNPETCIMIATPADNYFRKKYKNPYQEAVQREASGIDVCSRLENRDSDGRRRINHGLTVLVPTPRVLCSATAAGVGSGVASRFGGDEGCLSLSEAELQRRAFPSGSLGTRTIQAPEINPAP